MERKDPYEKGKGEQESSSNPTDDLDEQIKNLSIKERSQNSNRGKNHKNHNQRKPAPKQTFESGKTDKNATKQKEFQIEASSSTKPILSELMTLLDPFQQSIVYVPVSETLVRLQVDNSEDYDAIRNIHHDWIQFRIKSKPKNAATKSSQEVVETVRSAFVPISTPKDTTQPTPKATATPKPPPARSAVVARRMILNALSISPKSKRTDEEKQLDKMREEKKSPPSD